MFRLFFHLSDNRVLPVPLPPLQTHTLGRGEDNTIRLDHVTVSRHHARLSPGPGGAWVLEDLSSSNGVRVNGVRLARAELREGDEVSFGDVAAVYRATAPVERAQIIVDDHAGDPAPGRTFAARYRLQTALGETPEHTAYRAVDLGHLDRPVALKIFRPGVIDAAGGFGAVAARFAAIRAAPAHPNVAVLLDFARWRGKECYLVAEWVEGYPLLDVLRRKRALTVSEALLLARQAAAATTHARAHRLPPPDLGPAAVAVAFDKPLVRLDAWKKLLAKPVSRWPAFTVKVTPRLGLPEAGYPFGALLRGMLGAPPEPEPHTVPGLGERGNETLARGLATLGEAFGGDAAFVEMLARVADPRAHG